MPLLTSNASVVQVTRRPQSMLEARDLPHSNLSRHLQAHLDKVVEVGIYRASIMLSISMRSYTSVQGLGVLLLMTARQHRAKPRFQLLCCRSQTVLRSLSRTIDSSGAG